MADRLESIIREEKVNGLFKGVTSPMVCLSYCGVGKFGFTMLTFRRASHLYVPISQFKARWRVSRLSNSPYTDQRDRLYLVLAPHEDATPG